MYKLEVQLKTSFIVKKKQTKIMVSGPITLWQIRREKVEAMTDFIFLGSKVTADSDCSHEIKTLVLWKKS